MPQPGVRSRGQRPGFGDRVRLLAALSSGVFVIRYRVRASAWQTKMAHENPTTLRQDPGKNMTPSHMVIVGLGAIGVGLSFLVHNVGLLAAL